MNNYLCMPTYMIDWLDFAVDVIHDPIPAGRVLAVNPDGTLEWDVPQSMHIEGSYESKMRVRSQGGDGQGRATALYFCGNPSKFLQGHNVFGSDDVNALARAVFDRVLDTLALRADLVALSVARGAFDVKRIDITRSFQFRDRREVQAVLSSLAVKSRSRMGRAQTAGGTVYHGKNSRRYTVKCYCKAEELEAGKKHRLPAQLDPTPIKAFAENLLRIEVTLRSKELQQLQLSRGAQLTPTVVRQLHRDYFGRIEMSAQAKIPSEELALMTRAIRDTYLMWHSGIDVRPMMSQTTFYRHRATLLGYGVDIALPYEGASCPVIPLFREVVGEPVGIPEWAYDQALVYDPHRIGG